VACRVRASAEPPGGLDDHLDAQRVPRKRARIGLGEDLDAMSRDDERVVLGRDRIAEARA
jgi:hypothetical protein